MITALKPYSAMKDSGVEWLGAVPEPWEVRRIRSLAATVNGATPSSNVRSYWDGDIMWITPQDLGSLGSRYIHSSAKTITETGYASCAVVSRVAQAALRVSDLWFTFRAQAVQSITDEVADFLEDRELGFERSERLAGRSGRGWMVDFHGPEALTFVSLFDDTADVWADEDFRLVEPLSMVSRWSRPDELAAVLSGAA